MIPELNSYYKRFDDKHNLVHKLNIDAEVVNSKIIYNFYIGDGITKINKDRLKSSFNTDPVEDNITNVSMIIAQGYLHLLCLHCHLTHNHALNLASL